MFKCTTGQLVVKTYHQPLHVVQEKLESIFSLMTSVMSSFKVNLKSISTGKDFPNVPCKRKRAPSPGKNGQDRFKTRNERKPGTRSGKLERLPPPRLENSFSLLGWPRLLASMDPIADISVPGNKTILESHPDNPTQLTQLNTAFR